MSRIYIFFLPKSFIFLSAIFCLRSCLQKVVKLALLFLLTQFEFLLTPELWRLDCCSLNYCLCSHWLCTTHMNISAHLWPIGNSNHGNNKSSILNGIQHVHGHIQRLSALQWRVLLQWNTAESRDGHGGLKWQHRCFWHCERTAGKEKKCVSKFIFLKWK